MRVMFWFWGLCVGNGLAHQNVEFVGICLVLSIIFWPTVETIT